MDATDAELLATFARNRNEDAFRELVRRHLGMVFATARRLVGDAREAEEIAQTVFQLFAEKAGTLVAGQPLAGWLYHTTRHHALHHVRSESRRRQREQLAVAMTPSSETSPPPDQLVEELENALTELPADERDILVLRFLEDRQLREVGRELGVSEEAARKRVSRALDRLREVFARRGITASTGAITVALLGQSGVGVPATLGASITTTILGGTAAAATAALVTQTTATTMNLFNLKTAAAILGAAAVTGTTTYLVQEREADQLRADYQTLTETHGKLAVEQQEARELIQLRDEQIAALRRDVGDLPRLRGEVDRLNRELNRLAELQKENVRLRDQLTALVQVGETEKNSPPIFPGQFVTKDLLTPMGYDTPEAAMHTISWAEVFGDYDDVNEGFGPDMLAKELQKAKGRDNFESLRSQIVPYLEGVQVVARKTLAADQVEVRFRVKYFPEISQWKPGMQTLQEIVQPLVRVDGNWKVGGATQPYTPNWETEGQIHVFAK